RYPDLAVAGWFGGSLNNGGERLTLIDTSGRIVTSVDYRDNYPWPVSADGVGASLEVINPLGDPDDPANWHASTPGGTPGAPNGSPPQPKIRINELQAGVDHDWIELFNSGGSAIQLDGWSLTDNSEPRQFVFRPGTTIAAGGYLQ